MSFRTLIKLFVPAFRPLEKALLKALVERLPPPAAEALARQIDKVNLVQRYGIREINLYHMRWGKSVCADSDRLPVRTEIKFARLVFSVDGIPGTFTTDFIAVNGRLFSLVFDRDPRPASRIPEIRVLDFKLRVDPTVPTRTPTVALRPKKGPLTGWLGEWARTKPLAQANEPLEASAVEDLRIGIEAVLPPDYLELVSQCEGFILDNASVLGISEVHEAHFPERSFYLLAEIHERGQLGVASGSHDGEVFFLDYNGDQPRRMGKSLRLALEAFLSPHR